MIDYIKNNKILLVIGLIIIIAIFLIVMAIIPNRMYYSEEMSIDPDVVEVDEEELESFDKNFPPKKKEKREGQLDF